MKTKDLRERKLFNSETGRAVMIPMDHGLHLGVQKGIEDPVEAFKRFVDLGADTILVNLGVLKVISDIVAELDNPPGIMVGMEFHDQWLDWKEPLEGAGERPYETTLVSRVEQAVKYNADAVKVLFPLGMAPELQKTYISNISQIIMEADKLEMPVVVEPVTGGSYIAEENKADPEIIADGCRISLELGADIIKAPYPGVEYQEAFSDICDNTPVPIIMLGGPKKGGIRGVFETARKGVDAGSEGTIFGRNVWQRPVSEMKKVVRSLQDIVHDGAQVDEVIKKYGF